MSNDIARRDPEVWMKRASEKDVKQAVNGVRGEIIRSSKVETLMDVKEEEIQRVKDTVKLLGTKAIGVLEQVLDDEDSPRSIQVKAALELLKIGGYAAPTQHETKQLKLHLDEHQIDDLIGRNNGRSVPPNKPE